MNIRCSNRCAKPVRPCASSLDPTWYHTSTATSGLERSTCRITGSPFSSTNVSNAIVSIGGATERASLHESALARKANGRKSLARSALAAATTLLTALLLAEPAWGNGALPASFGILVPADRPQEIVLATNFGLIISDDGGATWLWTCEQPQTSFGYLYAVGPGPRDRFYGLSPDQGLAISDNGSCSWQRAGGALATTVASDFFVDRSNANRVLAIAADIDVDSGDIGPPSVFASDDAGATFSQTPVYAAPAGGNVVSVEIARSNPMVVYLAMYTTPGRHPHLLRSDDGGQRWADTDLESGIGANEFRILTVDPNDPDLLYLRVLAPGMEHVMVTRDAGKTFTKPVTVAGGSLSAFVRLASGTVLVGGLINLTSGGTTGVAYRSTDGGRTFVPWTLNPQPRINGLAERAGVLYIAGKNYSDGWALATSRDEGATVQPLSSYADVRGVKPCAMGLCGDQCALVASQTIWTNEVCTGALLDAGMAQDGSSDSGADAMDAGMDASTDARPPPPPPGSGCHCAAAPAMAHGTVAVLALAGLVLVIRRRRRRG